MMIIGQLVGKMREPAPLPEAHFGTQLTRPTDDFAFLGKTYIYETCCGLIRV